MKTTIDISDALFEKAKALASSQQTTLKSLIEMGLHKILNEHKTEEKKFKLKKATFKGCGLNQDIDSLDWQAIRDESYRGRGS